MVGVMMLDDGGLCCNENGGPMPSRWDGVLCLPVAAGFAAIPILSRMWSFSASVGRLMDMV